jgi:hypothetical protein
VARANFAAAIASGGLSADAKAIDLVGLCAKHWPDLGDLQRIDWLAQLLNGRPPAAEVSRGIWKAAGTAEGTSSARMARVVALILARPESQLT